VTNPVAVADVFRREKQYDDARAHLWEFLNTEQEPPRADQSEAAMKARRRLADVHHLLGKIAEETGDLTAAATGYRQALELHADLRAAMIDLGQLALAARDYDTASGLFERSIAIHPNDPDSHNQLGLVRMKQRRPDEAIRAFETALRISANWLPAANNLAWLRATCSDERFRDANRSIQIAERLARATGHSQPDILDTLAAGYAASGQFEKARATIRRAIEIATEQGNSSLADELAHRRDLYESGRTYSE
jgi:tetratricopeptide (TPR) repeat protein